MNPNSFEKSTEKFSHLWKMPPEVSKIIEIDPKEIDNEHLWFLDGHLSSLQENFPDISEEIQETRNKIARAMWFEVNVSWEVMQAANNRDYKREYRSVA